MGIERFVYLFRFRAKHTFSFTTDDLKRILAVSRLARNYACNEYNELSKTNCLTDSGLLFLQFNFTVASYLLHKISPEKFDEYGCTKYGETIRSREIAHILYVPEIVGCC